ncbi:hypothetical protein ACGFJT_37535 [Actinomadura geliboluensis]|uniref:hypothetical protein n=1 Tax=Actinomadura geliboluensis TaxID=882440 RepID=UPI003713CBFC
MAKNNRQRATRALQRREPGLSYQQALQRVDTTAPTVRSLAAEAGALWARGRYRDAAQLDKKAAALGDCFAAARLVSSLHLAQPTDQRPARWAVKQVKLTDPSAVAALLNTLREVGAHDQIAALLARDPAACVALEVLSGDDAFVMDRLLTSLHDAGAHHQATALIARAAAHTRLDHSLRVAVLLDMLRHAGADDQVAVLVARNPAAQIVPDDYVTVAWLVELLGAVGAHGQVDTLIERVVDHASQGEPGSLARLLGRFCERGLEGHIAGVAEQAVADAPIGDPAFVAALLTELHEAGADDLVSALLARDPARHVRLHEPRAAGRLLDILDELNAEEQFSALAERVGPYMLVKQRNYSAFAGLFDAIPLHVRPSSAAQLPAALQTCELVSDVPLNDPRLTWKLLAILNRSWPSGDPLRILLARDPVAHVCIEDIENVVNLLNQLHWMGAHRQAAALAERVAAQASINKEWEAEALLKCLRIVGTPHQVARYVERLPDAGQFELFARVSGQPDLWRFGRDTDGPANPWGWDDLE